jgi:hypothetical protein
MTVLAILISIAVMVFAVSAYVHKAREYLAAARAPWERLFEASKSVIPDMRMPDRAVGFTAGAVMFAGCGCLTRSILWDAITKRRVPPSKEADAIWESMTREQREAFSRVVINATYYDSLRAPLSGFLVRHFVCPWLRSASEGTAHPTKKRVAQLAASSRKAMVSRSEGKKLLALAH